MSENWRQASRPLAVLTLSSVYPMGRWPTNEYGELRSDVKPFSSLYDKAKELGFFTDVKETQRARRETWYELWDEIRPRRR